MISIIRSAERRLGDFGWLKTYWLFSFAEYHDPANLHWGMLRVFNDDRVAPGEGFPTHPHADMDIVTIVLEGEITHEDSMGQAERLGPGEIQSMSAGTGITHSEFNRGYEELHLYQLWLFPIRKGLTPVYGRASFGPEDWHNRLLVVASGLGHPGAAKISTPAAVYRSALDPGASLEFTPDPGRRQFLYLGAGELKLNGNKLSACDQARLAGEERLSLEATTACDLVLVDAPTYGREES